MPSPDHLERNLLQVQDDVGGVFDHAGDGAELVGHAFDAHGRDGRAFNRAQQHAAQAVADGGAESALERLGGEHAVTLGERFRIGDQPLWFLESFEHSFHFWMAVRMPARSYFEYNSTISCSFNWICTSSSRLGWPSTRARRFSRSTSSQLGLGAWAVASRGVQNRRVVLALLADFDHVVRLHQERRDIHPAAVHLDVAVANHLAGLRAGGAEAHAVNDVVQAALQHVEHVLAGDALHAAGLLEQIAELVFEQLIIAAGLLLFAKLQAVADDLRLAILAVLAGNESCAFRWRTFRCGSARP